MSINLFSNRLLSKRNSFSSQPLKKQPYNQSRTRWEDLEDKGKDKKTESSIIQGAKQMGLACDRAAVILRSFHCPCSIYVHLYKGCRRRTDQVPSNQGAQKPFCSSYFPASFCFFANLTWHSNSLGRRKSMEFINEKKKTKQTKTYIGRERTFYLEANKKTIPKNLIQASFKIQ